MIPLTEALQRIENENFPVLTERISLAEGKGRYLSRIISAREDNPPFDKSAMDGYAVSGSPENREWAILETIGAGDCPEFRLQKGEASRIMTGAPVPRGADRVIQVEYTEESDGLVRETKSSSMDNIIRRGENFKAGDPVLTPRQLAAQDIGILASLGVAEFPGGRSPVCGIIATGSEIVPPGRPLKEGQIYDSNGAQLAAQVQNAGGIPRRYGIAVDDPQTLTETIECALTECDLLILSGGVSKGKFDYVPRCLEEAGVEKIFHSVRIKPGKPTWFGRKDDIPVFGLPGNPVSTFVIFEVFVRRILARLQGGLDWQPLVVPLPLTKEFRRKNAVRTEFRPVKITEEGAEPLGYHGSSHLNGLAEADGLFMIEAGEDRITAGTPLMIRILDRC